MGPSEKTGKPKDADFSAAVRQSIHGQMILREKMRLKSRTLQVSWPRTRPRASENTRRMQPWAPYISLRQRRGSSQSRLDVSLRWVDNRTSSYCNIDHGRAALDGTSHISRFVHCHITCSSGHSSSPPTRLVHLHGLYNTGWNTPNASRTPAERSSLGTAASEHARAVSYSIC